ncbi:hypothetical protein FE374_01455 [Georgenia yuyongxinii]|uniref:Uncharacterized protein n=1 Tax=Georgenia yuyongxinii TaxID=2589797 RepID=A0A5B8BYV4_9MICO|nr:hypothetical protein [Georgenia yuyongxinii]QDC23473.1 hypothetical protein FE374_01455 [Georgenia yuyongxinii]
MTANWTRVVLAGSWITLMLIYLLGDVLRIFAGHIEPGKLGDRPAPGWMWTLIAAIMLVPIAMILTTLLTPETPLRWLTIGVSIALAIFNLAGMPYKGFFDNLLIVFSLGINTFIIWTAWTWETAET